MPQLDRPALLDNFIKHYAWGSRSALATLQGRPVPSPEPEAELWMGAHAGGPSHVWIGAQRQALPELIAADPDGTLGPRVKDRFGRLPFLLKVLAADAPLSIQAHPSEAQARAGFAAEQRAGVSLDAPSRNYKDPCHKPELICAVEPFQALCGFRELSHVDALAAALGLDALRRRIAEAARSESPLRALFIGALRMSSGARGELIRQALERCARAPAELAGGVRAVARWVVELGRQYPDDAGVLAPLLLNYVELEPGQALYLGAGAPHAYLRGVGIEIMASSDNVLRGGLTPKHVDVDELERVLRFEPEPVAPLHGRPGRAGERVYPTEAPEFRLSRVDLDAGQRFAAPGGEPEIWLCWAGAARLEAEHGAVALERGASVFVPASAGEYVLSGAGTLFRAGVGQLR